VPGVTVCPLCRVDLTPEAASTPPLAPTEGGTRIDLAPILRQALAARQPGEDLDGALLRALKARHPEHATSLFPALSRVIELESQRSSETTDQVAIRLAQKDSGLHINFRTSGDPSGIPGDGAFHASSSVTSTTVINIGGKEYHSLDEVPPDLRPMIERAVGRVTPPSSTTRRVGCSIGILALPFLLLTVFLHR
jgi:hypothetical protein